MTPRPHIYFFDFFHGAGFGSEVNNLLYAIYYFNQHDFEYGVLSKNWVSAFKHGWQDYFTSTLSPARNHSVRFGYVILVHHLDYALRKVLSRKNYFRIRYRILSALYTAVPQQGFIVRPLRNFQTMRNYAAVQRNMDHDRFLAAMHALITDLWQPVERIQSLAKSLRPEQEYIAVHVRRGDKVTSGEDRYYYLEEYTTAIRRLPSRVRNLFVMTDDVRVIEAMQRQMPEYNVLYNRELTLEGYCQNAFESFSALQVMQATDMVIAEVEVARRSTAFVGTYRSNLFRLIEYLRGSRCIDISGVDRTQNAP